MLHRAGNQSRCYKTRRPVQIRYIGRSMATSPSFIAHSINHEGYLDAGQSMGTSDNASERKAKRTGLKKVAPYWYPYRTMAKGRWFDREILEMISTEFRDRSVEYYKYALESGVTTVNGKIVKPGTIIRNGDLIENIVHRHEPPVTSTPLQILLHDKEREFVAINKPGSIPVHATGRYYKNTVVEILKDEFGFKNVYTVNRLDRLTSGLMIIALSPDTAHTLAEEFVAGTIRKEYIARVKGEFPIEPVTCEEPLLTVDRQMGLNIVHPEGKPAKTIFTRKFYDPETDTSVLHCQPLTGRSHQIRVHLQFLGYPIANDPVYSDKQIWGPKGGKGGIDIIPSDERRPPTPPPQYTSSMAEGRSQLNADGVFSADSLEIPGLTPPLYPLMTKPRKPPKVRKSASNPAWRTKAESLAMTASMNKNDGDADEKPKLLPRETGHDVGMGSPVPLSLEAVKVITKLRNQKDEEEDWGRWRDVIFKAKKALRPTGISAEDLPLPSIESNWEPLKGEDGMLYCPECYLPLRPDPKPEKLYIFLHAFRYTTSLGSFETDEPEWAARGWTWERDGEA